MRVWGPFSLIADITEYIDDEYNTSYSTAAISQRLLYLREVGLVTRDVIKMEPVFYLDNNAKITQEQMVCSYFINNFLYEVKTIGLLNLLEIVNQELELNMTEMQLVKVIDKISSIQISNRGKQKIVKCKKN